MNDGSFQATLQPNGIKYRPPLPGREQTSSGALWTIWDHDIREASTRNISGDEWDRYFAEDGPETFRRSVEALGIKQLFEQDLVLPIGPIDGLRQQLTDCYDEVMMAHGMTREDSIEDRRPVDFRNRSKILKSMLNKLPPVLQDRIREGKQVSVNFVVFLDAKAEPTACRLTTLPRYREFEASVCEKIVNDGRFQFRKKEEPRPAIVQAGYFYRKDIGFSLTGR